MPLELFPSGQKSLNGLLGFVGFETENRRDFIARGFFSRSGRFFVRYGDVGWRNDAFADDVAFLILLARRSPERIVYQKRRQNTEKGKSRPELLFGGEIFKSPREEFCNILANLRKW